MSLARAIYSRAGTLLLDDVLAAVDAHTARHIYDKGLKGSLARGRTLILVSHHIQLCAPGAAYVLSLESGGVGFEGTSLDFLRSEQYRTLAGDVGEEDEPPLEAPIRPQPRKAPSKLTNKIFKNVAENNLPTFDSGASSQVESSSSEEESETDSEDDEPKGEPRRLIEDEDRAIGHVSRAVWMTYLRANGHLIFWILFTAAFLGEVGMEVLETYVVRLWTNRNDGAVPEESTTNFYLGLCTRSVETFIGPD